MLAPRGGLRIRVTRNRDSFVTVLRLVLTMLFRGVRYPATWLEQVSHSIHTAIPMGRGGIGHFRAFGPGRATLEMPAHLRNAVGHRKNGEAGVRFGSDNAMAVRSIPTQPS